MKKSFTPPSRVGFCRLLPLMAVVAMFLFQACKKEQAREFSAAPQKDQLATMPEKRKYLNHHLKTGGNEIAVALQNPAFKKAMLEVLFASGNEEHIITFLQILKNPVLSPIVNPKVLQESIDAFKNLDGKDWSPSIRLHMPEKETDPYAITLFDINPGIEFNDMFAIYEGWPEFEMPAVPAFEIINGELWPIDNFYLTEENLEDQPVWVLELDESGMDLITTNSNDPLFGPQTCTNNNEPTFKSSISTMTVKERKEHWLASRSDIHIMRGTTWKTARLTPNNITADEEIWNLGKTRKYKVYQGLQQVEYCIADSDGDMIAKVPQRIIRRQQSIPLSFELMKSWKPIGGSDQDIYTYPSCNKAKCVIKGNIMYYTIFEFDGWPAPERTATIANPASLNGIPIVVHFRSWDGYYDKGTIDYVHPNGVATPTNIKGYNLNTHRIAFSTKIN